MRIHLTLLLAFSYVWATAQSFNQAVVAKHIQLEIERAASQYIPIYILLEDQVDILGLENDFKRNVIRVDERPGHVIECLKDKAMDSQGAILSHLQNSPYLLPSSIRSYWIGNLIFAEVQGPLIAQLSQMSQIAWIGYNGNIELESFERNTNYTTNIEPGGIEPGLEVIRAPEMWRMGYTGYGQNAYVIDTGTEPDHPALQTKFIGNFGPLSQAWFDSDPTEPFDCNDHGTHVCGTILGLDRLNNDTIGVAFNANWMASPPIACYRQSDFKGTERIIASFQWAMDPDGDPSTTADMPDVINNSWYDPYLDSLDCVSAYVPVFNALEAAGVAVVFSAGNEGPDPMTITPPHNINTDLVNSFTVGALNGNVPSLGIADFSSRGPSQCSSQGSLLIKPEVSAPGVNVRSSVRDGGYDNFSGTSMASPHTCGAILLLKEAFPYLTGHELKLALYFSARDLGEPGEDNTYGMGIIDVMAAYDYLVDEGHVPVVPQVTTDLMIIHVELDRQYCDGAVYSVLHVENGGQEVIEDFQIYYAIEGPEMRSETINWDGAALQAGERAMVNLPSFENLASGKYKVSISVSIPDGPAEDRLLNNDYKRIVDVSDQEPIEVDAIGLDALEACSGAGVVLKAEPIGVGEIRWYDEAENSPAIATGTSLVVPPLANDTTFYVDQIRSAATGIASLDMQTAPLDDDITGELIFDCLTPFVLKSVKVYSNQAGPRVIYLKNFRGITISSKLFLLGVGEQKLNLNFAVPVGKDHFLQLTDGRPLHYSDTEVQFPYEVPNVLQIKGSNDPVDPLATYYYFYDWQIEYGQYCGRKAVALSRTSDTAIPDVAISTTDTLVDWNNDIATAELEAELAQGQQIEQLIWDFGDGSPPIIDQATVTHEFEEPGTYHVSLTAKNEQACTNVANVEIIVNERPVAIKNRLEKLNILIFPNPASSELHIRLLDSKELLEGVQLFDLFGRSMWAEPLNAQQHLLDLTSLEPGIYYIHLSTTSAYVIHKFIKMN